LAVPAETRSFVLNLTVDPISPPLSCQPRCVVQPKELLRRGQLRLTERQSAVKMSFIAKRGLSTLIPPKVRLHTLSHTLNGIN
jgi:hypothetical protein